MIVLMVLTLVILMRLAIISGWLITAMLLSMLLSFMLFAAATPHLRVRFA